MFFFFKDAAPTEIYTSDTLFPYTTLFRSPRAPGAAAGVERADHGREQARRDRQVVQRVFGGAQFLAQALEGAGVVVVAVDVAQLRRELFESRLVDAAVVLEAVAGAFAQLVDRPARMGHADHRHVEPAARDHRLQRGKDLLVGKVAGGAEEHECVGSGGGGRGSKAGSNPVKLAAC